MPRTARYICVIVSLVIFTQTWAFASTNHIPEWFNFTATFSKPPEIGKPIQVLATLTALVGDIQDIHVSLIMPPDWTPASPTAQLDLLGNGTSRTFSFTLTAPHPVPNGSIQCLFNSRIPKKAIKAAISTLSKEEREAMELVVDTFPDRGKGYADIAFALFPEEGFFPLSSDMWLHYDDRLTPARLLRGPVLYRNSVLTSFQAISDVEMYEKLMEKIKADPTLTQQLEASGISLDRKRMDYLAALYTLGVEEYLKGNFSRCLKFLDRLDAENPEKEEGLWAEQAIGEGNLRGLCQWGLGNKKQAEKFLRKTFYKNRKKPVQRYVLRNLALLHYDMGNLTTAREMFRLGWEIKPEYTLIKEELEKLNNQ